MKNQTASTLVAIETVISHFLPIILTVVVLSLVGSLLLKVSLNRANETWTISVIDTIDKDIAREYMAYGAKPIIQGDNLIFENENGNIVRIPYQNKTIIVTETDCKDNKDENKTSTE